MLNLHRLKELILFDFCYSLAKLRSLAFIIPYFLFWYLIFNHVSQLVTEWIQSNEGLLIVNYFLQNQELVERLFVERPATLSIYFLISMITTPFFFLIAANDQYSSDAARGAFRFILTRTTRLELYLARFIAVILLTLICTLITSSWATLQACLNNEAKLQTIIIFGLQIFALLSFYGLPFIAFMSIVSSLARSAFGCLFFGMGLYIFIIIVNFLLNDDIAYTNYLIPSAVKPFLINVNNENFIISITALTCYTLIYLSCGWFIFKRRDM